MSKPFLSGSGTILSLHRGNNPSSWTRVRRRLTAFGVMSSTTAISRGSSCSQAHSRTSSRSDSSSSRSALSSCGWSNSATGAPAAMGSLRSAIDHPTDEPQPTLRTPAMIRQAALGDAVRPGKWVVERNVIEAPPDHEQRVVEQLGDIGRLRASAEVALQRLVHQVDDGFELSPSVEIGGHHRLPSSTDARHHRRSTSPTLESVPRYHGRRQLRRPRRAVHQDRSDQHPHQPDEEATSWTTDEHARLAADPDAHATTPAAAETSAM